MKKYIRNPRQAEVHDVRGKKRQEAYEGQNEQQDDESAKEDGD